MTSKLFESQARARQVLVENGDHAWMIGNSVNSKTPGYSLDHIISLHEAESVHKWDAASASNIINLRWMPLAANIAKGSQSNIAVYERRKAAWDAGNYQALPNIF